MSNRATPILPERTYAQRVQDDEDHRLRMCGLLPDEERDDWEQWDVESRRYDFIFAPRAACHAGAPWEGTREQAGTPFSSGVPAELLRSVPRSMEGLRAEAGPLGYTPRPDGPATDSRRAA